jgi:hypothetical protein
MRVLKKRVMKEMNPQKRSASQLRPQGFASNT